MDLKKQSLRGMQRDAARRQSGIVDTSVLIDLDEIVVDETIQVRQTGLDQERVNQYALAMIEYGGFGEFPALVVFRDPESNVLRLAGGFHRRAAVDGARQPLLQDDKYAIEQVPCEVRTGDALAAVEFAEDDNLTHGMDLTNRDKRAIFERRLQDGHVWNEYSNRRIAAELGMSEFTIRNWKKDLTARNIAVNDSTTRIGQDGRLMDVSGIQEAAQERTQVDPPAPRSVIELHEDRSHWAEHNDTMAKLFEPDEMPGHEEPEITKSDTLPEDHAVDLLAAELQRYAELSKGIALRLEQVEEQGISGAASEHARDVYDFLNGYYVARNDKWIAGVIGLLEDLLGVE